MDRVGLLGFLSNLNDVSMIRIVNCVHTPEIPVLRRLVQEDHEFKASLGDTVRPYLGGKQ